MLDDFRVPFGSGGPPEYYFRLCRLVNESDSTFAPSDFPEWLEAQSEQRVEEAERQIKELNVLVQKFIFDRFKETYGLEGDAYWHKGVLDKDIRTRAYKKSLDSPDEDRLPLENYLDFIEYKKIVENREHWQVFKPVRILSSCRVTRGVWRCRPCVVWVQTPRRSRSRFRSGGPKVCGFRAERCATCGGMLCDLERNAVRFPPECCATSTGIRIKRV